jgi:hypothetical protein
MAAVLACGEGALLSHRSAAALWRLVRPHAGPIDVTSDRGRGRPGVTLHHGRLNPEEATVVAGIPVTSVARTLLDLAEVVPGDRLGKAFEEADRLGLVERAGLEGVCARARGRRGLGPIRNLMAAARAPDPTRSVLEDRFASLCREHGLPPPSHNAHLLGHEVDVLWRESRLVVELDGFTYHRHRAAFERDRARDAALQAAGYRVIRLTYRRIEQGPAVVAAEIARLLEGPRGAA